ncbi:hypothetical protein A0H81_10257 [Grifola frondosa]|uniref:Uncharacterized protein n=1 Tax=Grifola frondosa TaxID=5627 RepID=A0A1C7M0N9_GRIFR|nr:hypothetical protein A0H81_10257 [Grifola frondosa]
MYDISVVLLVPYDHLSADLRPGTTHPRRARAHGRGPRPDEPSASRVELAKRSADVSSHGSQAIIRARVDTPPLRITTAPTSPRSAATHRETYTHALHTCTSTSQGGERAPIPSIHFSTRTAVHGSLEMRCTRQTILHSLVHTTYWLHARDRDRTPIVHAP